MPDIIDWRNKALQDRYTRERTPLSEISGSKQRIMYIVFRYLVR